MFFCWVFFLFLFSSFLILSLLIFYIFTHSSRPHWQNDQPQRTEVCHLTTFDHQGPAFAFTESNTFVEWRSPRSLEDAISEIRHAPVLFPLLSHPPLLPFFFPLSPFFFSPLLSPHFSSLPSYSPQVCLIHLPMTVYNPSKE